MKVLVSDGAPAVVKESLILRGFEVVEARGFDYGRTVTWTVEEAWASGTRHFAPSNVADVAAVLEVISTKRKPSEAACIWVLDSDGDVKVLEITETGPRTISPVCWSPNPPEGFFLRRLREEAGWACVEVINSSLGGEPPPHEVMDILYRSLSLLDRAFGKLNPKDAIRVLIGEVDPVGIYNIDSEIGAEWFRLVGYGS